MTPEERAVAVVRNATGPIEVKRYACDALEGEITRAIREAERAAAERMRERCAAVVEDERFVRYYRDDHEDNADIARSIRALPLEEPTK